MVSRFGVFLGSGVLRRARRFKPDQTTTMSDDLTKRGPQDRSNINIHEAWELKYWSCHFGVTQNQLIEAVRRRRSSVPR